MTGGPDGPLLCVGRDRRRSAGSENTRGYRRAAGVRLLLGEDQSLVSAYFTLSGPWQQPEARLIPMKSIASGPAIFVLEGLPAFVKGSLARIQAVLPWPRRTPEPASDAAQADS